MSRPIVYVNGAVKDKQYGVYGRNTAMTWFPSTKTLLFRGEEGENTKHEIISSTEDQKTDQDVCPAEALLQLKLQSTSASLCIQNKFMQDQRTIVYMHLNIG